CGPASLVAPSSNACPWSDVTSSAVMPHVPTYHVLPYTCCGFAGSLHPASAWHDATGFAAGCWAATAAATNSITVGANRRTTVTYLVMTSLPSMYGRSTGGTTTVPSFCW